MDTVMCSIGQSIPNQYLGSVQDPTDTIKSCAMTDMFSQRPRNKRKDFYPSGIIQIPDEGAINLSNDEMNSEGESNPASPLPPITKDEGMDLTQRQHPSDQRLKYGDTANDFALNGLKMPTTLTSAMDFHQQQQELQYHLQQLQQQTQENQRQFQQQIQQQIEQQQLQNFSPVNVKTEPGIMNKNGMSPNVLLGQSSPSSQKVSIQNNNISTDAPIDFSTNTQIKQEKCLDGRNEATDLRSPYGCQNGAIQLDSVDVQRSSFNYQNSENTVEPMDARSYGGYANGADKTDDGMNDYLCRHCRRPFKSQINLDRHMEKAHNPKNSKIFTCLLCPYTTKFYSNMYVHIRTHTGDKPYWCGACGASFSQGSSLKIHIISKHGGNKQYFILDRKLGKANLLRFWQRRDSNPGNEEHDIKPDIHALNAMMSGEKGMRNTDTVDGHAPNNGNINPAFMGAHQLGHFGMLPNGMGMLNPMMNPLGLNLFSQNPLAAPNMMMGGMNLNNMNGNMFVPPQGLLNGLNLKNSAFFTKTTTFDLESNRDNDCKQSLQKTSIVDGKHSIDNKNNTSGLINNGHQQMVDNGLIPNMNAILQGQAKLGLEIPTSQIMKEKLSPSNQHQLQAPSPEPENLSLSHSSPAHSGQNSPLPSPYAGGKCQSNSLLRRECTASQTSPPPQQGQTDHFLSPSSQHHNHSHSTSPGTNSNASPGNNGSKISSDDDCPYEQKLKDLRKNVVKMLHMMLPDLPMDKELNRESDDVDLMLMDVIRSTVIDCDDSE